MITIALEPFLQPSNRLGNEADDKIAIDESNFVIKLYLRCVQKDQA